MRLLVELSEKTQLVAIENKKLAPSFVSNLGWGEGDGARKSEKRRAAEESLVNQLSRCVACAACVRVVDVVDVEQARILCTWNGTGNKGRLWSFRGVPFILRD